jgi:hypothetical protein
LARRTLKEIGSALGALALALAGCDEDPWEQARKERETALRKEREAARKAAERAAARRSAAAAGPDLEALARIVRDPQAALPTKTLFDGSRVYFVSGVGEATLEQLSGRTDAWSWSFQAGALRPSDLAPPGGLRDLLGKAPAAIHGFPIRGVLHQVTAGPLHGAILVHEPGAFSRVRRFQIASVSFLVSGLGLLRGPLCDAGVVPGTQPMEAIAFKDACKARVAVRLGARWRPLWPAAWGPVGTLSERCDRTWKDEVPLADGRSGQKARAVARFTCSYDATGGKLRVQVEVGR